MTDLPGNTEAILAWNTVLFDKFLRYRPLVVTSLEPFGTRAMARLPLKAGMSVVDIGCGFGETTQQLGALVGSSGRAVGVDAAARFIDVARRESEGTPQVRFEVADVEVGVPGGPYDAAFSRMGVMFFNQPVIALRNVRKALRPGAMFAMSVWRKKEANEGMYVAELVAREILGHPPKGDQVTCGPGPFSMASPDLVSDQLVGAGYTDIAFERADGDLLIGHTIDDAIDFALTLGPAGEIVRLAGAEGQRRLGEIEAALRGAIEGFARPDGIYAPATTWIVTARVPS